MTLTTPLTSPAKRRHSSLSQHSAVTVVFLCSSDRLINCQINIKKTITFMVQDHNYIGLEHE